MDLKLQYTLADKSFPRLSDVSALIKRAVLSEQVGEDALSAGDVIEPLLKTYWALVSVYELNVRSVTDKEMETIWRSTYSAAFKSLTGRDVGPEDGWPESYMFSITAWPRPLVVHLARLVAVSDAETARAFREMAEKRMQQ